MMPALGMVEARRLLPFLVCWVALSLMSAMWSLATPISASPDEPNHFIKAASVVRGQLMPPGGPDGSVVQVPRYVAFTKAQTCFAFQSEQPADCAPALSGDPGRLTTSTTTAGLYNPVYYFIVGWPSLIFHDRSGLYAMRFLSGVAGSIFLALVFVQLLALRRRAIVMLSFAVAVTPMVLFLMGSVNPNSLETTATLSVFVTSFMLLRHPDRALLTSRAVILILSTAVAITMRGLSPLWVALALFSPLLLGGMTGLRELLRSTWIRVAIVAIGVAAAFAIGWILVSNSLGAGTGPGAEVAAPNVGASPLYGFALVLFDSFSYDQGLIGFFGWLDTPAPPPVFFVWSFFIGTLTLLVMIMTRGRPRLLALVLLAGVILVPAILQGIYVHSGGIIWQGRYTLPLFVCFILALGLLLTEAVDLLVPARRLLMVIVLAAWAIAQIAAFTTALRRYSVGLRGSLGEFVAHPAWSPPLGVLPTITLFSAVTVGMAVLLMAVSQSRGPLGSKSSLLSEAGGIADTGPASDGSKLTTLT